MPHPYPPIPPGQTIGLLGGSFDPPHEGHVHITREALRRFGLDRVWWLVSPGNPLKPDAPADLDRRLAACTAIMRHPRVQITDVERHLRTRHTAQTLKRLRHRYPAVRFTWLMGADNLVSFHHWQDWEEIFAMVPIGVLARPGEQIAAGLAPAARTFARYRLPETASTRLARSDAPAWCLVPGPMVEQSSTALRRAGHWTR